MKYFKKKDPEIPDEVYSRSILGLQDEQVFHGEDYLEYIESLSDETIVKIIGNLDEDCLSENIKDIIYPLLYVICKRKYEEFSISKQPRSILRKMGLCVVSAQMIISISCVMAKLALENNDQPLCDEMLDFAEYYNNLLCDNQVHSFIRLSTLTKKTIKKELETGDKLVICSELISRMFMSFLGKVFIYKATEQEVNNIIDLIFSLNIKGFDYECLLRSFAGDMGKFLVFLTKTRRYFPFNDIIKKFGIVGFL